MQCKKCKSPSVRAGFCQEHYDWWRAYQNEWRKKNPGYRVKENERKRAAYAADPEPHRAEALRYYAANKEQRRAYTKQWNEEFKASHTAEEWRARCVEKSRQYRNTFRGKLHGQVWRANQRATEYGRKGRLTYDSALLVYERQDGKCFDCGTEDDLSIGHAVPLFHDYSTGGPENLIFQCRKCNSVQHNAIHPKFRDAYWARVKEQI